MITLYFIRNKKTGKYLSVTPCSNEGADHCNETGADFSLDQDGPFYHTTSHEKAQNALNENPPWYSSSLENPRWFSNMDNFEYEIVEVILPE